MESAANPVVLLNSWVGIKGLTQSTHSKYPRLLLSIRFLSFLYTTFILLLGIYTVINPYLIFLTHWGVILVFSHFLLSLLSYIRSEFQPLCYVCFEAAWVIEVLIVVVFWTLVFPFVYDQLPVFYNLQVHGVLMGLLIVDYSLNRIRFKFKHMCLPFAILLGYTVLSIIITFTIQPIYPLLTYKDAPSYLFLVFSLVIGYLGFEIARRIDKCKYPEAEEDRKLELGEVISENLVLN